jgi:small subunit ribosomal protein S18
MVEEAERAPEQPAEAGEAPRQRKRRYGRRRKVCPICAEQVKQIDYKNNAFLRRFLTDRGRIESRRKLNTCAKHQRALARAIKRARHLALLPFTAEHIRKMGWPAPTPSA